MRSRSHCPISSSLCADHQVGDRSDSERGIDQVTPSGADRGEPQSEGSWVNTEEESIGAFLDEYGLTVSNHVTLEGETIYKVSGETQPIRDVLLSLGGRWDVMKQVWVFNGVDPAPVLANRIESERLNNILSDSAVPLPIVRQSHSWSRRRLLRDRFLACDDTALIDSELLELLLFFAGMKVDTWTFANRLIARFGSLAGVVNASTDQLSEIDGVNHFAVTLFKAVRVLAARLVREDLTERPILDNWDVLISYLRATMAHRMIEQFRLIFLDRRNVLIADEVQQEGTIDHTPVYTREVVKRALALDASAIVMVHNHPSNHPAPSKPDIEMTKQVRDALDRVGIVLHDHLIISRRGHSSFRQMGIIGR